MQFHMFTLLYFKPLVLYWGWRREKNRALKWWKLMPLVSHCFIQFLQLFHTAWSLFMSMTQPRESCPFLSEDIALPTGSLSHPRYCFWFAMGYLCNCKMYHSPKTKAGQSYPIHWLSRKMLKELNQTSFYLMLLVFIFSEHLGDLLPIANSQRLKIWIAVL